MDFVGETTAGVRVADAAVVTVSAHSGVEVGTEMVWKLCDDRSLPRMVFVSMMDKDNANFQRVYREVKDLLAPSAIPVEIPIGSGDGFRGIVNLFSKRAHMYKPGTQTGEYTEEDIPEDLADQFSEWETELMETLATTDEALLDRYLEGEEITREEAIEAMALAVGRGRCDPGVLRVRRNLLRGEGPDAEDGGALPEPRGGRTRRRDRRIRGGRRATPGR